MEKRKKNILIALIIAVIIITLGASGWVYYIYKQKQAQPAINSQEQKIQDQLKQLDALRQQYNVKPLTEQQISQQLQQLQKLKQSPTSTSAANAVPVKLTQDQIQQQLDALQKLKQSQ